MRCPKIRTAKLFPASQSPSLHFDASSRRAHLRRRFYVRRQQNREIELQRAADAAAAKERTDDALTVEQLGGSEFQDPEFLRYAPVVHAGEAVQLCYGVSNAKTVKLEPQTNPVWPSVA